ncbi:serine-rich adhesin for platelets isoform X3 [Esox lucius]|uniref:serine-rich adhesin for platelets isoform X3 n=1 Tax=Esox lucius TaxID=8010 RepID=UPI001476B3A6|nr:serine-rich adhesin for platelets isoform X3 [Esox lucius]
MQKKTVSWLFKVAIILFVIQVTATAAGLSNESSDYSCQIVFTKSTGSLSDDQIPFDTWTVSNDAKTSTFTTPVTPKATLTIKSSDVPTASITSMFTSSDVIILATTSTVISNEVITPSALHIVPSTDASTLSNTLTSLKYIDASTTSQSSMGDIVSASALTTSTATSTDAPSITIVLNNANTPHSTLTVPSSDVNNPSTTSTATSNDALMSSIFSTVTLSDSTTLSTSMTGSISDVPANTSVKNTIVRCVSGAVVNAIRLENVTSQVITASWMGINLNQEIQYTVKLVSYSSSIQNETSVTKAVFLDLTPATMYTLTIEYLSCGVKKNISIDVVTTGKVYDCSTRIPGGEFLSDYLNQSSSLYKDFVTNFTMQVVNNLPEQYQDLIKTQQMMVVVRAVRNGSLIVDFDLFVASVVNLSTSAVQISVINALNRSALGVDHNSTFVKDADLCQRGNYACSQNASCVTEGPSYSCNCQAGFYDINPVVPGTDCMSISVDATTTATASTVSPSDATTASITSTVSPSDATTASITSTVSPSDATTALTTSTVSPKDATTDSTTPTVSPSDATTYSTTSTVSPSEVISPFTSLTFTSSDNSTTRQSSMGDIVSASAPTASTATSSVAISCLILSTVSSSDVTPPSNILPVSSIDARTSGDVITSSMTLTVTSSDASRRNQTSMGETSTATAPTISTVPSTDAPSNTVVLNDAKTPHSTLTVPSSDANNPSTTSTATSNDALMSSILSTVTLSDSTILSTSMTGSTNDVPANTSVKNTTVRCVSGAVVNAIRLENVTSQVITASWMGINLNQEIQYTVKLVSYSSSIQNETSVTKAVFLDLTPATMYTLTIEYLSCGVKKNISIDVVTTGKVYECSTRIPSGKFFSDYLNQSSSLYKDFVINFTIQVETNLPKQYQDLISAQQMMVIVRDVRQGSVIVDFDLVTAFDVNLSTSDVRTSVINALNLSTLRVDLNSTLVQDADLCQRGNYACSQNASCVTEGPSYSCICQAGFYDINPVVPGTDCMIISVDATTDSTASTVSPSDATTALTTSTVSPSDATTASITSTVSPSDATTASITSIVSPSDATTDSTPSTVSPSDATTASTTSTVSPSYATTDSTASTVSPSDATTASTTSTVSPSDATTALTTSTVSPKDVISPSTSLTFTSSDSSTTLQTSMGDIVSASAPTTSAATSSVAISSFRISAVSSSDVTYLSTRLPVSSIDARTSSAPSRVISTDTTISSDVITSSKISTVTSSDSSSTSQSSLGSTVLTTVFTNASIETKVPTILTVISTDATIPPSTSTVSSNSVSSSTSVHPINVKTTSQTSSSIQNLSYTYSVTSSDASNSSQTSVRSIDSSTATINTNASIETLAPLTSTVNSSDSNTPSISSTVISNATSPYSTLIVTASYATTPFARSQVTSLATTLRPTPSSSSATPVTTRPETTSTAVPVINSSDTSLGTVSRDTTLVTTVQNTFTGCGAVVNAIRLENITSQVIIVSWMGINLNQEIQYIVKLVSYSSSIQNETSVTKAVFSDLTPATMYTLTIEYLSCGVKKNISIDVVTTGKVYECSTRIPSGEFFSDYLNQSSSLYKDFVINFTIQVETNLPKQYQDLISAQQMMVIVRDVRQGSVIVDFDLVTAFDVNLSTSDVRTSVINALNLSTLRVDLNSTHVQDANLCQRGNYACSQNASCVTEGPSYSCKCQVGLYSENPALPGTACMITSSNATTPSTSFTVSSSDAITLPAPSTVTSGVPQISMAPAEGWKVATIVLGVLLGFILLVVVFALIMTALRSTNRIMSYNIHQPEDNIQVVSTDYIHKHYSNCV